MMRVMSAVLLLPGKYTVYRFICHLFLQRSLSILGIPFSDMMRVMSAVLLLGNIEFVQGSGLELDLATNSGKTVYSILLLLNMSSINAINDYL